ncbi:MAG: DUF4846 domain-containing protein [Bacteroidota bacterium]
MSVWRCLSLSLLLVCLVACQSSPTQVPKGSPVPASKETFANTDLLPEDNPSVEPPADVQVDSSSVEDQLDSTTSARYVWLDEYDIQQSIRFQIPVPSGSRRIRQDQLSFAHWLRHLPLKAAGSKVLLHDGTAKFRQDVHHRIVDIDRGRRDLQQCADAVMRLKAEYHYSQNSYADIHFNYTSGDRVSFDDWRKGRKPWIDGNRVRFREAGGAEDNSYANFKKYLISIFSYAGTASLEKELQAVSIDQLQAGDVFIQGGFPGHAVLVMDVAEGAAGQTYFLLAQSYMPAQDIHILKNPTNASLSPWYAVEELDGVLQSPEWTFETRNLKRFP